MNANVNIGTATYSTATGYSCITSGPATVYGVLVHGSSSCGFQLFSSSTATAATAVCAPVSASSKAVYFPIQTEFPTGFCLRNVPSLDPKLTLFWSPTAPV